MYCVNCGVKLADSEKTCPLCGTIAFHPDIKTGEGERLYPSGELKNQTVSPWGVLIVLTTLFLMSIIIPLLCDLQINGCVGWSGYVVGGLLVAYIALVLPWWFRKPNPVIFVPCSFAAVGVYLLYISLVTNGNWFLGFAFPVVGFIGLIATAVAALLKYLRRGRLYIFGGASLALGGFMPVMELLLTLTFVNVHFVGWSLYPMVALVLLGGMLIFLAIFRPARETMERKLFL